MADSFLTASHITHARQAHQVTAASLHILTSKAYDEYTAAAEEKEAVKPLPEWKEEMSKKCPQFLYWSTVMDLQLCCLQLVRAFRSQLFLVRQSHKAESSMDVCNGPS